MATPSFVASSVTRDVVQRIHRITRENRSLWYQLTVLQQPERARACGSGMKANSDRRPVDPPPVVELRIIEGPTVEEGKDITFDYNANFFLYASLEQARNMAHGRVHNSAANNPPILTGVPASGMAYLDRPTEAGYFIFPDLSVRHEGYFRLSLSLYELTKEEKDFDLEPSGLNLPPGVDWRMEIKTKPFNVFSAKKFPGLMESTSLSKTVADQGCRVRIRRDVRMRKREGKGGGYDRREEDYGRRRAVSPGAPPPPVEDNGHNEQRMTYVPDIQRRPSIPESYSAPLPPPPPPPPPPSYDHAQPSPARPSHLSFGEHAASQYAAPRQYGPSQSGPAVPVTLAGPYHQAHQPAYGKMEAQSFPYSARSTPQPHSSPAMSERQDPYDNRVSGPYVPPSPSVYSVAMGSQSRRQSQASYTSTAMTTQPSPRNIRPQPPIHPAHPIHSVHSVHSVHSIHPAHPAHPVHPVQQQHSSLSPLRIESLVTPLPPIEAQTEPLPEAPILPTGAKRKHDFVFSQNNKPLHNGQRQLDPHFGHHAYRGLTPEPDQGVYSRADGKIGYVTFNQYQI